MKFVLAPTFGLDDEECAWLRAQLEARTALTPDERTSYTQPERVGQSAWLAFNWQIGLFWQDRPFLLMLGTLALVWQVVRLLDDLLQAIIGA